jgi:hypothetical protein
LLVDEEVVVLRQWIFHAQISIKLRGVYPGVGASTPPQDDLPSVYFAEKVFHGLLHGNDVSRLALPAPVGTAVVGEF